MILVAAPQAPVCDEVTGSKLTSDRFSGFYIDSV